MSKKRRATCGGCCTAPSTNLRKHGHLRRDAANSDAPDESPSVGARIPMCLRILRVLDAADEPLRSCSPVALLRDGTGFGTTACMDPSCLRARTPGNAGGFAETTSIMGAKNTADELSCSRSSASLPRDGTAFGTTARTIPSFRTAACQRLCRKMTQVSE